MEDDDDTGDPSVAWLLELRLKARGNRAAMRIIDRCPALCALNPPADIADHQRLNAELQAIAEALALTYGAPKSCVLH